MRTSKLGAPASKRRRRAGARRRLSRPSPLACHMRTPTTDFRALSARASLVVWRALTLRACAVLDALLPLYALDTPPNQNVSRRESKMIRRVSTRAHCCPQAERNFAPFEIKYLGLHRSGANSRRARCADISALCRYQRPSSLSSRSRSFTYNCLGFSNSRSTTRASLTS
jgi:hypothetical protein